ncbi:glycine zipper 2TM domain-containing protein [Ideonella sp. BN130291]|uniref:glycine zipper 2TM domain-containing protein n=1 Tax=Ideonella sp. BN130291 TaxID=3112940 RepID=UPI002E2750B2|nr:glycine zipper 2TM domain-containing protein [Ideonella sp. BN130291]
MTDNTTASRPSSRMTSPAAMIGAAVMIASLGAAAGWMMSSSRQAAPADPVPAKLALAPNETVVPPASLPVPQPATVQPNALQATPAPEQQAPAPAKPAPTRHAAPRHQPAPKAPATTHDTDRGTAVSSGTGSTTPLDTRPVAVCHNCGVIEGVREVTRKGEGSGVGAIAGGVLGGVLGHQVGGGNGRKAMTVIGAVGGGLAGHEIEKRAKSETVYEARVRLDDGSVRTITQKTAPTPGTRVVVEGNTMRPASQRESGQGA